MKNIKLHKLVHLSDEDILSIIRDYKTWESPPILFAVAEIKRRNLKLGDTLEQNLNDYKKSWSITNIDENITRIAMDRNCSTYTELYVKIMQQFYETNNPTEIKSQINKTSTIAPNTSHQNIEETLQQNSPETKQKPYYSKSWKELTPEEKPKYLKLYIIGGLVVGLFFIIYTSNNKTQTSSDSSNSTPPELNDAEKRKRCLRMYGTAPDMTAFELAQAECLLKQEQAACECMQILSK